jgi:uncharacterized protein YlxW (UPF0749 family)
MEDKQREIRALHMEHKRQIERTREVELENDRLKQDHIYQLQSRDADNTKLKSYISELENTVNSLREENKEIQKSKGDQQRFIDINVQRFKTENEDLKR